MDEIYYATRLTSSRALGAFDNCHYVSPQYSLAKELIICVSACYKYKVINKDLALTGTELAATTNPVGTESVAQEGYSAGEMINGSLVMFASADTPGSSSTITAAHATKLAGWFSELAGPKCQYNPTGRVDLTDVADNVKNILNLVEFKSLLML